MEINDEFVAKIFNVFQNKFELVLRIAKEKRYAKQFYSLIFSHTGI